MSNVRIPSQSQLDGIRANWCPDGADGETIHMLCDAVEFLKLKLAEDPNRATLPSPHPEELLEATIVGMGIPIPPNPLPNLDSEELDGD